MFDRHIYKRVIISLHHMTLNIYLIILFIYIFKYKLNLIFFRMTLMLKEILSVNMSLLYLTNIFLFCFLDIMLISAVSIMINDY